MTKKTLSCVDCSVKACRGKGGEFPEFCPSKGLEPELLDAALELLRGEHNALTVAAACNEADSYTSRCRVEETARVAKLMGARKIGIAACAGLDREARAMARFPRAQGYEVYGVCCKCGAVKKTEVGIPETCMETGPHLCNPVLQAMVLNREKTDLNVAIGLCVGHDSLFYKYSEAYVTTLVAKDRLLGHNPAAPLYLLDGYWKRLLEKDPFYSPDTF